MKKMGKMGEEERKRKGTAEHAEGRRKGREKVGSVFPARLFFFSFGALYFSAVLFIFF
jgi:hypothetical protein